MQPTGAVAPIKLVPVSRWKQAASWECESVDPWAQAGKRCLNGVGRPPAPGGGGRWGQGRLFSDVRWSPGVKKRSTKLIADIK